MSIAGTLLKKKESLERRVLGAIRFVDALSGLPVNILLRIEAHAASVIHSAGTVPVPVHHTSVGFLKNRSGLYVITHAPLFEGYENEFKDPRVPESLQGGFLRLTLAVIPADPRYLPQEFDMDIPRQNSATVKTALSTSSNVDKLVLDEASFAVPVTGGTITVNDKTVHVQTDQTLAAIFAAITTATAGSVNCRYNEVLDEIVLIGSTVITLGSPLDTSNFLIAARLQQNGRTVVRSHGRVCGSVFVPLDIPLHRSPCAQSESSWIVLRTRVTSSITGDPLPGVLVRVYRSPRNLNDIPVGVGLTDWRGNVKGEALVNVAGVARFQPGNAGSVMQTEQAIEFETVRDPLFTGHNDRLPHGTSLYSGCLPGLIVAPSVYPAVAAPGQMMQVCTGREYSVSLSMP